MAEHIKPYITQEQLEQRVKELGAQIAADYKGKDLLLISILKGAVVFLTDLMRAIPLDSVAIDFMVVSSYGTGTSSTGNVRITKDLSVDIVGKDVLIVEDILDTGNTLSKVFPTLLTRNPSSLKICTLLDKPSRRISQVPLAYSGFTIPDEFVVGYGLDYSERYRNLPYIGLMEFTEDKKEAPLE